MTWLCNVVEPNTTKYANSDFHEYSSIKSQSVQVCRVSGMIDSCKEIYRYNDALVFCMGHITYMYMYFSLSLCANCASILLWIIALANMQIIVSNFE